MNLPLASFAVTVTYSDPFGRPGYSHVWCFNGTSEADACDRARKFLGQTYPHFTAVRIDRDDSFDNGCQ